MDNQILCISYFDQIIGPNRFFCSEPLKEGPDSPDLNKILEFNDEEGTFIFAFRKYQTVNHLPYAQVCILDIHYGDNSDFHWRQRGLFF